MSATTYAKVTLGFGLLLFICAILFEPLSDTAHAAGFDVCRDGSCRYTSIALASAQAPAGAVITVGPGVYDETVTIDRPLTLIGPGAGRPGTRAFDAANEAVVTGTSATNGFRSSFDVRAPRVTIDGFTLGPSAPAASGVPYGGVYVSSPASDFKLNSSIVRNVYTGISLQGTTGASVGATTFVANTIALYAARVAAVNAGTASPVTVVGSGPDSFGLIFEWSKGVAVGDVRATDVGTGVNVNGSDDVTVGGETYKRIENRTFALARPEPVGVTTPSITSSQPSADPGPVKTVEAAAPGSTDAETVAAVPAAPIRVLPATGRTTPVVPAITVTAGLSLACFIAGWRRLQQ